eukprot:4238939-Alexandrium_andersonii.AAC.1
MSSALKVVLQSQNFKAPGWTLDDAEQADWVRTIEVRIRCVCRHLQQGLLRKARWLGSIPDLQLQEAPSATTPTSTSTAGSSVAASQAYFFGFEAEVEKAWRAVEGGTREYSTKMLPPKDGLPTSPM